MFGTNPADPTDQGMNGLGFGAGVAKPRLTESARRQMPSIARRAVAGNYKDGVIPDGRVVKAQAQIAQAQRAAAKEAGVPYVAPSQAVLRQQRDAIAANLPAVQAAIAARVPVAVPGVTSQTAPTSPMQIPAAPIVVVSPTQEQAPTTNAIQSPVPVAVVDNQVVIPPASTYTPAEYIGTPMDMSPQATLDTIATGTADGVVVDLYTDAFRDSTAPYGTWTDIQAVATDEWGQLWGLNGGGGLGSWLSKAIRSTPILSTAVAAIPGVGPIASGIFSTIFQPKQQQAPAPAPAPAAMAPVMQAAPPAAPAKTGPSKMLVIGGIAAGVAALVGVTAALRRK